MASFSLDKTKLSLLAACLTAGLEMAPALNAASEEDEQALAALLEELDAIATRGGSAEITIMGDEEWKQPDASLISSPPYPPSSPAPLVDNPSIAKR